MNGKNKQLEEQCINLLKAINILEFVDSHKVQVAVDQLSDLLQKKVTKLTDKHDYLPWEIDEVLKRAV